MCNDEVRMELMAAVGNRADFKTDKVEISNMLAGDDNVNNADPYDTKPDSGEVWVQEEPHLMIRVPVAGLSEAPYKRGPYIMRKRTPYRTPMVPIGPHKK